MSNISKVKDNNPDKYKRILAECFVNNISLSKYLVRNGYAFDYAYYLKKNLLKIKNMQKIII